LGITYLYSDHECNHDFAPEYTFSEHYLSFDLLKEDKAELLTERKKFYSTVLFTGWLLGAAYSIALNRFQTSEELL